VENIEHYVYMVIDEETFDVKYIGKGKGKRCFNILSGISNNYEANKAYHTGLTEKCGVFTAFDNLTNDLALKIEKSMIYTIQPTWNSDHKNWKPNVSSQFIMIGWRIKALIQCFKWGLFKQAEDRTELMLNLFDMIWYEDLKYVQEYIEDVYAEATPELKNALLTVYDVCTKMAIQSQEDD